jgi:hypothetical protein
MEYNETLVILRKCYDCDGWGITYYGHTCATCNGSGKLRPINNRDDYIIDMSVDSNGLWSKYHLSGIELFDKKRMIKAIKMKGM